MFGSTKEDAIPTIPADHRVFVAYNFFIRLPDNDASGKYIGSEDMLIYLEAVFSLLCTQLLVGKYTGCSRRRR